jgi:hypothetical protein
MEFFPKNDPALTDLTSAGSFQVGFTPDQLVVSDDIAFVEVQLAGGVVYGRGDLLEFDAATNTAQPAADAGDARMICPFTITAQQATSQSSGQHLMQVYCQGEFNEMAITLQGVPLTAAEIATAKGVLNAAGNIRLRRMT